MDIKELKIGDRIELHPGTDLWMRGARYGEVVRFAARSGGVLVKLDNLTKRYWVSGHNIARKV